MKTIEEGALDHIHNTVGEFLHKDQSFKAGVDFAQRWIPVEEELPDTNEFEESKICLVKNKYRIDIGRYYSCQKRWWAADMEVTHWRQIELE